MTLIKPDSKMPIGEMFHMSFLSKVVSFNEPNVAAVFSVGVYLLLTRVSSLAAQSILYPSPVLMHQKMPRVHYITKYSIIHDHNINFT